MTRYVEALDNRGVRCVLCPHHCRLKPGQTGICGVRRNEGGNLTLPYFGKVSALAIDPIEKKPLYHFHPGKQILSAGFLGCNLHCPFCQNFRISQSTAAATEDLSPDELVGLAESRGSFGIAYTYNEPVIHAEYILEAAAVARSRGLKNVLVTAAFLDEEPAKDIFSAMDAANIDLKGYNEEFYRREIGGRLDAVLRSIRIAASRCHLEVTTLVIPGRTDSPDQIDAISAFVADLSPNIPFHLSAYFPTYHYTAPATPPDTLLERAEAARKRLNYVYTGHIGGTNDTVCPHCGATLVSRSGYRVRVENLKPGAAAAGYGRCGKCGTEVPIVTGA
ncbi:MAG: AmmeMemoRadiSam system radical SAM enzyme [Spirochaetota bacterium]